MQGKATGTIAAMSNTQADAFKGKFTDTFTITASEAITVANAVALPRLIKQQVLILLLV